MTNNFELFFQRLKTASGCTTDISLANYLSIKKTTLSMWKSREKIDHDLIFNKFEHISMDWLFRGIGEMHINENIINEPTAIYSLKTDNKQEDQRIPLYDIEAAAGLAPLFNDTHHNPIDYITIPNLPKCDGALSITGDSMYPLLKSGDIVMYKQIQDFKNDVFFGEMYLISVEVAGEEHIMVKYIQKSDKGEKYLKLVSYNQNHQSKDLMIGKVRAMALIKASIRINSMN